MHTSVIKKSVIVLLLHFALVFPLFAASQVNYDTAWTFVYDGGKDSASGDAYLDCFFDIKALSDGSVICAGYTGYSNWSSLLFKLDSSGKGVVKKTYTTTHVRGQLNSQSARSVYIAKNGDIIVGGERYRSPWVMRLDSTGTIKWTAWYYDTTQGVLGEILTGSGFINSIHETSNGRIICAIGDEFPHGGGSPLDNYAAYLEYDSLGNMTNWGQWDNEVGEKIAGFSIDEISENRYFLAGNKAVFCIDTAGTVVFRKQYSFMLDGVGSVINNITRAKILRDGTLMVAGQAYEGNCWASWQKLYYDAWWSPVKAAGATNITWDTAGMQGADDFLYDFTQLSDGKLVFVGKNAMGDGVWTFVTDSSGKELLWEKQTKIKYMSSDGRSPRPFSVCATPDSGFTLVGEFRCEREDGDINAFAAHFKPAPASAVSVSARIPEVQKVRCNLTGSTATFTLMQFVSSPVELSIYNAAGKLVFRHSSMPGNVNLSSLVWDFSGSAQGVYFYRVGSGELQINGKMYIR